MTTLLPPSEVGKAALVTTGTAFFALFLINPVGMFINRRLHDWVGTGRVRSYFHLFCLYIIIVALIAALISWLLATTGVVRLEMAPLWFSGLVAASLIFNTINQTLVPSLNMLGRTKPFVALTIATLLLGLLTALVLVKTGGPHAALWLAGPLISQAIFSGIAYHVFFRRDGKLPQISIDGSDYKRLFAFCWPISIAVGLNWLHLQGYRFLLADKFGLADMGLFAAGYGLSTSLVAAIESICTTWFQPKFYRDTNSVDSAVRFNAWSNYARLMLPLSAFALTGIVATAPYLTQIMLGPQYQASSRYVVVGALAEWVRMLINVFGLSAHQRMRTKALIIPSLIGVIFTYVAMAIIVLQHDLVGAPVAVSVGGAIMCMCLFYEARRAGQGMRTQWLEVGSFFAAALVMAGVFIFLRLQVLDTLGRFEPFAGLFIATLMWVSAVAVLLKMTKKPIDAK